MNPSQKKYILNWIRDMEKRYPDSSFIYGYSDVYDMHIIKTSPVELFDNDDFKQDVCLLYTDFESKYDVETIVLPVNDEILTIGVLAYETDLESKVCLSSTKFSLKSTIQAIEPMERIVSEIKLAMQSDMSYSEKENNIFFAHEYV
jgi:hypothetical protein